MANCTVHGGLSQKGYSREEEEGPYLWRARIVGNAKESCNLIKIHF